MKRLLFTLALLLFVSTSSLVAAESWQTLRDCKYLTNKSDDGDSFHVQQNGKEYIFRLYFVDTPEAEPSLKERVAEQATYFGITPEQAVRVGKDAAKYTEQTLRGHPLKIVTRWQDALGRSKLERFYAFVYVDGKDLNELLVADGLARIHGTRATLPNGEDGKTYENHLKQIESKAKHNYRGAWGVNHVAAPPKQPTPPPALIPATNSTVRPSSTTSVTNGPVIVEAPQFMLSTTGKRHNSKCRYFNNPKNTPCGPTDGEPCKACGG